LWDVVVLEAVPEDGEESVLNSPAGPIVCASSCI